MLGALIKVEKEVIRTAAIEATESAISTTTQKLETVNVDAYKPDAKKASQVTAWVESLLALIKNAKAPKIAETSAPVAAARLIVKLAPSLNGVIFLFPIISNALYR